ncbi:MAG: acyltransferase family protein [Bacteroidota bacterium]
MRNSVLSHLYRKTTSNAFIPEVDGFRFFAIATVLFYHLNTHLSRVIDPLVNEAYYRSTLLYGMMREGGIGVNVFFAISGFILALPFARARLSSMPAPSLRPYYLRRLTRLEPPYVVSLLAFLIAQVLFLHLPLKDLLPHFGASLLYVHTLVYDQWSSINPVAWSLEVEVQFYLLAPLLASVFSIRNVYLRRGAILLVMLAGIVHYNYNYEWINALHLRKSLVMHLHQFLVGFLMAEIYLVDWEGKKPLTSYAWDVLGILSTISLLVFNDVYNIFDDLIFCFSLLLTFVSVFRGTLLNKFYSNPLVVVIGGMCYSLYLLHYGAYAFLVDRTVVFFNSGWGYAANFWIQALLLIPVVLLVCSIFFVLVERPCMDKDWPRKLKAKVISIFA